MEDLQLSEIVRRVSQEINFRLIKLSNTKILISTILLEMVSPTLITSESMSRVGIQPKTSSLIYISAQRSSVVMTHIQKKRLSASLPKEAKKWIVKRTKRIIKKGNPLRTTPSNHLRS